MSRPTPTPSSPPPHPGKQRPIFITKHAIERYQQRIENVPDGEAVRRLRTMAEPHRLVPAGVYTVESRKAGPPASIKIVANGEFAVLSVYPVTNAQKARAAKHRNWSIHD